MKKIEDYLHLYINQWCELTISSSIMTREGFEDGLYVLSGEIYSHVMVRNCQVKPILRPLSSITPEERLERGKIIADTTATIEAEYHRWMLSKGFDIFGLIEAGLAIEKKD